MMVIMWFSGLRGAIAYALSLHLEFEEDVRKVIVTTTLVVVLFTTICLGEDTLTCLVKLIACLQNSDIDLKFIFWNNIHAFSLNQEEEHYHQLSISKERNQPVIAKNAEETKNKSQCPKQESWDLLLVTSLTFIDPFSN